MKVQRSFLPARGAGLVVFIALLLSGCARTSGGIGGEVPETPLSVVATDPAPLSIVEPFGGPVRIRFQRTVSERPTQGSPNDAVLISPRTGEVEVNVGGSGIEISMEGGFRLPAVYRITLLPVFRDRYDNGMTGPVDLIFSTGPELEPNLLAGIASDRITFQPAVGARIDALPTEGGAAHSTVADSTGIFTFAHLPAGSYTVVAYDDRNRNREADYEEPQATLAIGMNRGDTLVAAELLLLAQDTTPAELEGVVVLDSLTLRANFDDSVDPSSLGSVTVLLSREGANAPEVVEIAGVRALQARRANPNDPLPPDALRPTQELAIVLSRPLLPGVEYEVEVQGVINMNGIPAGGGIAEVSVPEAPEPPTPAVGDPLPADTLPPTGAPPPDPLPG